MCIKEYFSLLEKSKVKFILGAFSGFQRLNRCPLSLMHLNCLCIQIQMTRENVLVEDCLSVIRHKSALLEEYFAQLGSALIPPILSSHIPTQQTKR